MTEEHSSHEEPGVLEDGANPADQTPPAASLTSNSLSVEPKGYPDVGETGSDARQEESISGEEEDFLSE
jgi:hypothetical protein